MWRVFHSILLRTADLLPYNRNEIRMET